METVFKEGDRVFDIRYGFGHIECISEDKYGIYPICVAFEDFLETYTLDGRNDAPSPPILSFTEYTLSGFSQERPRPVIEKDTPIWVRNAGGKWVIRCFSHFNKDGRCYCFDHGYASNDSINTSLWDEYSLENPFKKMDK